MARKTETREIDGIQFRVTQLGFASGRKLLVRLAKTMGPSLATLAGGAKSLKDVDLVSLVRTAVEGLEDSDLESYAEILGEVTQWSTGGGKWPALSYANREELFSGRILLFFRWLMFALEVQYADFSGALKARNEQGQEGDTPESSQGSTPG